MICSLIVDHHSEVDVVMFDIQEELKKMPEKPGIYIMKDESGNIIYVGKAIILKNRVRQYFQASTRHSPRIQAMVSRIREFEYIVTDNELEALILECSLIKKHRPRFNILLKDDKNYPYIKVTMNEDYPRVLVTRRLEKDGARYFGPYSNAFAVKDTVRLIKKLFPIKTCKRVFPRDIGKERPCLNYHIYQCIGPCRGDVSKEEYRAMMKDICSFLEGKQEEVAKNLQRQMKEAAEGLEFEKAARLRDKIASIGHIAEKQKVLTSGGVDQDIIAMAREGSDSCLQIFFVRDGKLLGKEHFIIEGVVDDRDGELVTAFIKQFYGLAATVPRELLLQDGVLTGDELDEIGILEQWLSEKAFARVHIKIPQRGDKKALVEMVARNATIALDNHLDKMRLDVTSKNKGLEALTAKLGLDREPERIEAYDISNTGTSEMVASMVVFQAGKPDKSQYRRFRIKSQEHQNDYGSMQEVITRRFSHLKADADLTEKDKKFSKRPGLLLIDGGLGHLNAVREVLQSMGVSVPVFGMVKDDRHRTRGLVSRDGEIDLTGDMTVLRFVTGIQDEAHRFALDYNKKLRSQRQKLSALDGIQGVGPGRKKALLKHFGSVKALKTAGVDDIAAIPGISTSVAQKIYDGIHIRS